RLASPATAAKQRRSLVEKAFVALCRRRSSCLRLDQDDARRDRLRADRGDQFAEPEDGALRPARRIAIGSLDASANPRQDPVEGGEEAVLLAVEERVEVADPDLAGREEVVDRRLLVPALGEDGDHVGQDPIALVPGEHLARELLLPGRGSPQMRRKSG